MDFTMQLIIQVASAVVLLVIVALYGAAIFAVVWAAYHMLHDHWSMRQVWERAWARRSR